MRGNVIQKWCCYLMCQIEQAIEFVCFSFETEMIQYIFIFHIIQISFSPSENICWTFHSTHFNENMKSFSISRCQNKYNTHKKNYLVCYLVIPRIWMEKTTTTHSNTKQKSFCSRKSSKWSEIWKGMTKKHVININQSLSHFLDECFESYKLSKSSWQCSEKWCQNLSYIFIVLFSTLRKKFTWLLASNISSQLANNNLHNWYTTF